MSASEEYDETAQFYLGKAAQGAGLDTFAEALAQINATLSVAAAIREQTERFVTNGIKTHGGYA